MVSESGLCECECVCMCRLVAVYLMLVYMHASMCVISRWFRESVCVCVVRAVGGRCLYKCMATHTCVSATMCHFQHMLPSSSPFGGRLSCGTQQDSPWHDPGGQHGARSQGPRGSARGLEKAGDLFVSSLSPSVCPCELGGRLHHTHAIINTFLHIEMYKHMNTWWAIRHDENWAYPHINRLMIYTGWLYTFIILL